MLNFCRHNTMLWRRRGLEAERTIRHITQACDPTKATIGPGTNNSMPPMYQHALRLEVVPYWKHVRPWKEVPAEDFLQYGWQVCD